MPREKFLYSFKGQIARWSQFACQDPQVADNVRTSEAETSAAARTPNSQGMILKPMATGPAAIENFSTI